MLTQILPQWFIPILLSAFSLGFYDICKKLLQPPLSVPCPSFCMFSLKP